MPQSPLQGLKVVEFAHMVMGPTAGLALADLGADVIKVEPEGVEGKPAGDNTRRLKGAGTGFFAMLNRNKRSLVLDLKSPEGLGVVKTLLERADVLIENFRPGALDKLGLSYEELRTINPRLIYCSCKGFLPGPYDHRVALDEVVQMMGGLAYMTGLPGRPMRAGSSINDILGGTFAALGILAAVEERHRTGLGKHVQSGLFETNAVLVAQHMAQAVISGQEPPPMGVRRPAWPVYDVFRLRRWWPGLRRGRDGHAVASVLREFRLVRPRWRPVAAVTGATRRKPRPGHPHRRCGPRSVQPGGADGAVRAAWPALRTHRETFRAVRRSSLERFG